MVKFIFLVLLCLILGFIFSPYLPQVFGGFSTAFTSITTQVSPIIDFIVSLFANILNKPYFMLLIGALLVFAIINLIIDFIKGGKK